MASTFPLSAHVFAIEQEKTFTSTAVPRLHLTKNMNGTYTVEFSFAITFQPDIEATDSDRTIDNPNDTDYAGFPDGSAGLVHIDQGPAECQFRASDGAIVFSSSSIKTTVTKLNHGN